MITPEKLAQAAACLDFKPKLDNWLDYQDPMESLIPSTRLIGTGMGRFTQDNREGNLTLIEMREAWAKVKL